MRRDPRNAAPLRSGKGAGTDEVPPPPPPPPAFIVRDVAPGVKSRNVGKAVGSAASTKGLMSAMVNSVMPERPKSVEKKYSFTPSEMRSANVVPPTTRSRPE